MIVLDRLIAPALGSTITSIWT